MADQNLGVSITANASQLLAEVEIVKARLGELGRQMRAVAKEALVTGDTSALQEIAARYQATAGNAARLGGELKALAQAHKDIVSPMAAVGTALSAVRTSFVELGASLSNLTSNILPSFKTVAALSIGAAVVEFVHLADSAASSIRETENLAKAFGLRTEAWEATRLVMATSGVETEKQVTGMQRLSRFMGQAREEQVKLTGATSSWIPGLAILRGSLGTVAGSVDILKGGVKDLASQFQSGVQVFHGAAQAIPDFSNPSKTLQAMHVNLAKFKEDSPGQIAAIGAIGAAFQKLAPSQQALAGQQMFGRGWAQIVAGLTDFAPKVANATAGIERSGAALTEAEKGQAKIYNKSLAEMEFYVTRIKEILGGGLGQGLLPVFEEIKNQITANSAAIRKWADETGKYLGAVGRDFINMFKGGAGPQTDFAKNFVGAKDTIVAAFEAIRTAWTDYLMPTLTAIANGFNAVFGTHLTGGAAAAIILIGSLSGAFGVLAAAVGVAAAAVGVLIAAFGGPLAGLIIIFGAIALQAAKNWELMKGTSQAFEDMMHSLGEYIGRTFVGLWNSATDAIKNAWASLTDWISGKIDSLLGVLQKLLDMAKEVASAVGGALSASTGGGGPAATAPIPPPLSKAMGGLIRGPGTGTSDSMWARVSTGEFWVNAAATARNLPLLHAINSGFDAPRLAVGGLIDAINGGFNAPRLGFAMGGLVTAGAGAGGSGGGAALHLHFPNNQTVAVQTDAQTLAQVERAARSAQLLSAGKRPGWSGS